MVAIMYETKYGMEIEIFQNLEDAKAAATNIAIKGISVTLFDYDIYENAFVELYTI